MKMTDYKKGDIYAVNDLFDCPLFIGLSEKPELCIVEMREIAPNAVKYSSQQVDTCMIQPASAIQMTTLLKSLASVIERG